MIDDRHRHPASRSTSMDEIVDRELEELIEGGETLMPETVVDNDMTAPRDEEINE